MPVRVLIVDDEAVILELLVEFFADVGIASLAVGDAEAALRAIQDEPAGSITVILTDIKMPGQDGLSFAQSALGTIAEINAVEVIVMTGHGSFSLAVDALRSRVFDFLRKPLKLADLEHSIRRAHAAAVARRDRAAEDALNVARLREMTLALSMRAAELTARMRGNPVRVESDVIRVISDELRAPLVPVVGLAELIEENADTMKPRQVREYAGLIRQAGWQLTNLVEVLVNAAAPEARAEGADPSAERVSDIVAALLLCHGAMARQRGQSLEAATPPEASVAADRASLKLALDQLVVDAIRSGRAGRTVRIETRLEGPDVIFEVIHHGEAPQAAGQDERPAGLDDLLPDGIATGRPGLTLADRIALVLGGWARIVQGPGGETIAILAVPAVKAAR